MRDAGCRPALLGLIAEVPDLRQLVAQARIGWGDLSHLIDGGAPAAAAAAAAAAQDVTVEDEIVSAISAAIRRYERNHGLRRGHP
jgi:hypothetical protein